jgi:hypothetical protein
MTSRKKQGFTQERVALPECRGCDNCPEVPSENELFVLGYNMKWFCRACFFKMATRWPRRRVSVKPVTKESEWIESPEKFRERWEKGEKQTDLIAERLRSDGLDVKAPQRTFRKTYADRKNYKDETDLIVNGRRIEVKSRRFNWTSLDDYPYDTIFVDTVKKWDGHKVKPLASINVSQVTGAVVVVPGKSSGEWMKVSAKDKDTGFVYENYAAPRGTWKTYEQLVDFLKSMEAAQ